MKFFGFDNSKYMPSCGLDPFLKGESLNKPGPPTKWKNEKRYMEPSNLEIYLELNTELLDGNAFALIELDDGVGV